MDLPSEQAISKSPVPVGNKIVPGIVPHDAPFLNSEASIVIDPNWSSITIGTEQDACILILCNNVPPFWL